MFVKPISVYFITNSRGCPQEFTKAETFFLNFQILRFFLEKIEFLRRISLFSHWNAWNIFCTIFGSTLTRRFLLRPNVRNIYGIFHQKPKAHVCVYK